MNTHNDGVQYEYPDSAGYPDGAGFLDEGTKALRNDSIPDPHRDFDLPSADAESEVAVHRDDVEQIYAATIQERAVASIRFEQVDDRVIVLKTSVVPEFRGRGIAGELIADALDDIRGRGLHVTVFCPLVAAFISQNQQFADLIDPQHPGLPSSTPQSNERLTS